MTVALKRCILDTKWVEPKCDSFLSIVNKLKNVNKFLKIVKITKVGWKMNWTKFGTFRFKITQPLTIHQVLVRRSENLRHEFFGFLVKIWLFSINQGLN